MKSKNKNMFFVLLKRHGDRKGGHWHVILETFSGHHVSVGTTSKKKKGKKAKGTNYLCENDILGNGNTSYLRRQGTVDKVEKYYDNAIGKMAPKDYQQAKIYGARAREKFWQKKK